MNVKDVCQRLYDSSSGIRAVGIAPWNGHHDKTTTLSAVGGAFLTEPDPMRPWKDLLLDAYRMWHNADRHRSVDQLHVKVGNQVVLCERQGSWVVVVGTLTGHEVRKSLRRLIATTFRNLEAMEDRKVILLYPEREKPKKASKGKGNRKPG